MSLYGMKEIKKSVLCAVSLILAISLMLLFYIMNKNSDEQELDSDFYCKKIFLLQETSNELSIDKIFDFDFDKAYIAGNEVYGDEEYFLKKLDVSTAIDIPTLESGAHNRILFVKDDTIIYDFVYLLHEISIDKKEQWIFPDTVVALEKETQETISVRIKL